MDESVSRIRVIHSHRYLAKPCLCRFAWRRSPLAPTILGAASESRVSARSGWSVSPNP